MKMETLYGTKTLVKDYKHNLCVAAIFRNESLILQEWLEHYRARGVSHIYLIDDRSSDDYMTVLQPYLKSGFVSLHHCEESTDKPGRQDVCYNRVLGPMFPEINWLLLVDVDEFVWDENNLSLVPVTKEMDKINKSIYRVFMDDYGDNGHVLQPASVVSSFTRRAARIFTLGKFCCKSLVKVSCLSKLGFITTRVRNETSERRKQTPNSVLRLNHYKLQSRERWEKIVVPRGSANATENVHHRHSKKYWDTNTKRFNKVEDLGLVTQNKKYGCEYKP